MRSNLAVGVDTAKGLSVAWQIPFVAVHHMQAHLLTPRLVSSMNGQSSSEPKPNTPRLPFASLLVSGGHTFLVNSTSLTQHRVMADTCDLALGVALDKTARTILPDDVVQKNPGSSFGTLLEQFAFPNGPADYAGYKPPKSRGEEILPYVSEWDWSISMPLANSREPRYSFTGIPSTVDRIMGEKKKRRESISDEERVHLARAAMQVCFEHLASRTTMAMVAAAERGERKTNTLVVSGGVAANRFLMTVLRSFLDARGFRNVKFDIPPPYLCTDNAAMIGWAGIEMYEAGWRSDLGCRIIRSWSLDPDAEDGGIMGADGWVKDSGQTRS
jgi:N6-L-threonylcarbamoyladenine synthase